MSWVILTLCSRLFKKIKSIDLKKIITSTYVVLDHCIDFTDNTVFMHALCGWGEGERQVKGTKCFLKFLTEKWPVNAFKTFVVHSFI